MMLIQQFYFSLAFDGLISSFDGSSFLNIYKNMPHIKASDNNRVDISTQWKQLLMPEFHLICQSPLKKIIQPQLVWLSRLSISLLTKGSLVQFLVRVHAWVVGQVPSRGLVRGNHTLMFLSLSFSFPSSLKINK